MISGNAVDLGPCTLTILRVPSCNLSLTVCCSIPNLNFSSSTLSLRSILRTLSPLSNHSTCPSRLEDTQEALSRLQDSIIKRPPPPPPPRATVNGPTRSHQRKVFRLLRRSFLREVSISILARHLADLLVITCRNQIPSFLRGHFKCTALPVVYDVSVLPACTALFAFVFLVVCTLELLNTS